MPMALIDCGVGGQKIQVFFAIRIPNLATGTPVEHYREGMVILGPVLVLQVQCGIWGRLDAHGARFRR
jgi:hypothetical protein